MASSNMTKGEDVVDFLKGQHQEIKSLLSQVESTRGEQRQRAFTHLRTLLAVHETAEEMVVHPKARRSIQNGEQVVDLRLDEENKGKRVLAELEKLDVDSTAFDEGFSRLHKDVLEHAENEEKDEFPQLAQALDEDQLQKMRKAAELAEKTAPTHPHPGVETGGQNMLAGPFASMMDRVKDALSRG